MGSRIGIDLGTTNSVAAFKFVNVEIVRNTAINSAPNRTLTPSIVAWSSGSIRVGEPARQTRSSPENIIFSIKRLIGRGFNEQTVQDQIKRFPYKITTPTQGTDNGISVWLNNQEYEPEDISAEILKTVVKNAQEYQQQKGGLTGEIFEAVITVPAYFNDKQRHATKIAATRAGLNCLSLLPEPTAAAISYGFRPDSSEVKTILVYDLGGGTFDASVITVAGDSFIELGKAGDLWLGGDDIDDLITDLVKYQVESSEEIDDIDQLIQNLPLHQRLRFIADLKAAAEEAKILLSTKDSARVISSTPLLDEMGMMIPIDVEITRDQLDKLLLPLVEKSIKVCQDAISLSEYENELIDAVLLVGGSSQIPLIKRKLSEVFGDKKVFLHPEPMYAVAQGAAIVAAGHVEKVGTVSRDYFIELANNPRYKLISQGDILPVHKCYTFGLESDNQRLIHFKFYNKDNVRDVDELVGQMWLSLDRPYPRGTEILVSMELDEQSSDISITSVLKNNPSIRVSSTFSRGRSDEKLYNEVVEVINDVNERNLSKRAIDAITEDVIKVVKSTNKIIDASNGRECQDHHQKAVQELAQLKTSISEDRNISEIWISEFEVLLEICPFLISQSQQERMQSIIQSLKNALANNDLSAMQAYSEKAERESDGLPELVRLVQMCRFAIQRAYAGASSDANIMADKFGRLLHALKNESVEADRLWRDLQPMIKQWIDCELPSASISTGLVNT